MPDWVEWFLHVFTNAATTSVSEWQSKSLERSLPGDTLPEVVHLEVLPCYVDELREDGMSHELAEAVWNCYEADSINLEAISSLQMQRAFE